MAKKGTTKRDVVKRRSTALSTMNESLRQKSDKIEELNESELAETIHTHYKVGKICKDVVDDPEEFGPNPLPLLCDVHGFTVRNLQRNIRFVEYFPTEEDLERLLSMYDTATGFRLQWAHIDYLLTIDDEALRWQFAERAATDNLSPKQLNDRIKKRLKRTGGHGRPHAVPRTLEGQLDQLISIVNTIVQKSAQVWIGSAAGYSLWRTLTELAPEGCSPALEEKLTAARAKLEEVQTVVSQNLGHLSRAESRVTTVNRETAAQQAIAEAAGESAAVSPPPASRKRKRRVEL